MDGSETTVAGGYRLLCRPDLPSARLAADATAAEVEARLGWDVAADLVPVGQDGAFARDLGARFHTAGGVVTAVRRSIGDHLTAARLHRPLAPRSPLAAAHRVEFPIAQGPMTRVSDRAEFANEVSLAGGMPFLALSLLSGDATRALLEETAALLGDRPWGVAFSASCRRRFAMRSSTCCATFARRSR
jgi:hypothetical protein